MLVTLFESVIAYNLNKLKMRAAIVKRIEYSYISFIFSNNFKVEDIQNYIIISMLDNLENMI